MFEKNSWQSSITHPVSDYFKNILENVLSIEHANQKLYHDFGFLHFFDSVEDMKMLQETIFYPEEHVLETDRAEYGDFQTNSELAGSVVDYLSTKNVAPEIVIEPTCGKGNFIIASLKRFESIKKVFGIEIYKPYVWETKFNIINYYLNNPTKYKPEISIIHGNVFNYDFKLISKENETKEVLIVGNPPWVTNSKLGSLNSSNLPEKTNFKNHSGLDAITGKSNFDLAEYITLMLVEIFQCQKGNVALLVKNSVIKNIVFNQFTKKYKISDIEKHSIDSKKEFNVSVEASLFYCQLNALPTFSCIEFDFYSRLKAKVTFGWLFGKFVSNIDTYSATAQIDGLCPLEWRQGIKHDCSSIMELDKIGENTPGHFINGLKEAIELEEDLIYGILKSSDLKNIVIKKTRKYTIITQKKVGQETNYIKQAFPKTYQYLLNHQDLLSARKSSIYKNKPPFSIFGVGDYSFKPYKIAISGLYKTFHFTLVLPQNQKPIVLDDTCYMLGFDRLEFAVYSLLLLNSKITLQFLRSITFADAKRTFTKDVLMRINLVELAKIIDRTELQIDLDSVNSLVGFDLTLGCWDEYINLMQPIENKQIEMFA